jgi:hypothetical protein
MPATHMDDDDLRSVRPYPAEFEERLEHRGRELLLRPIRPEDMPRHRQSCAYRRSAECARDAVRSHGGA